MTTAYLTFDDAPSASLPASLDVLEAAHVPALLFCEGRRLAEEPAAGREAIERGFHPGNHTESQPYASACTAEGFRSEVRRTERHIDAIYDRTGVDRPGRFFRFPYGHRGGERAPALQSVLAELGFGPPAAAAIEYDWYREDIAGGRDWFWTIDVEDWAVETPDELRAKVTGCTDRLESPSADIVLFHDATAADGLLGPFIDALRAHGVSFADPLSLVDTANRAGPAGTAPE